MSKQKTALTVVIVFLTIFGMTAIFAGSTGAAFGDASTQSTDSTADTGADNANDEDDEDDDGHDHSDEPPENNPNPDDPPCDADHGHPANNSEQCDDDGAGNGTDGHNGNNGNESNNGNNGNETNNGDSGNETDNGGDGEGDLGTCEQDGAFQNNTVANEAFGTENEEGPISSEFHANEEEFQELEPVVHEGSCVIATVDNNA